MVAKSTPRWPNTDWAAVRKPFGRLWVGMTILTFGGSMQLWS
jgi:hypothetical protein